MDSAKARRHVAKRFGRLVVLSVRGPYDKAVLCRCDCGALKHVSIAHLRAGKVVSCGCLALEKISGGAAPTHVLVKGERLSMGELGVLAERRPTAIWARMRKGMSVEEAAFGVAA
jgi:hypothetical protein